MYETFFGLNRRPFAPVPQVDQYFPGKAIEAARGTLFRCIQRAEGVGMVVGPSGTGKTLLCQMLAAQLKGSLDVALLTSGRAGTRRALLQAILYELGRPYRGMDEGELRLALADYLTLDASCAGMVLLIDEAHTLPLRLLEEIRLLTNLARNGQARVRIVLAGGPGLEERFASPKLDSFSQRIVARCYLEAFSRDETQAYIHAQIDLTGGHSMEIFPPETCQCVYKATDGVPRLINQVCDHAMLLAYADERKRLEPADVEEAWADLQQLPSPWNSDTRNPAAADTTSGGVIEFGGLDDATDEQADADYPEPAQGPSLRISPETDDMDARIPQPVEQLQQIEQMLTNVEEDFQPVSANGPEIELVFDETYEPFREQFEEEEIVAQRYAADNRAAEAKARRPALSTTGTPCKRGLRHEREHDGLSPVSVALHRSDGAAETLADDGDMIIVEDRYDDTPLTPACPVIPVRRQEYKRLFSKLRHG